MTKVIIVGAKGRMGRMLVNCASQLPGVEVAGEADIGDDLSVIVPKGDVVIEFSAHTVTVPVTRLCAEAGKAIVIGTTGHSPEQRQEIQQLANRIPIVFASNYSTGVNTLFWLTRKAAEILGTNFDLEIVEMHHRLKKDAPSGTATTLAEILASVRQAQLNEVLKHGRSGIVGQRTSQEIGMHAVRGGDVVGDHTVIFATNGERLELTHKASSRDTFANGALRAAAWAHGKKPGLYSMQHVLGLE